MNTNTNEPDNRWPPPRVVELPPMAWPTAVAPSVQPLAEPPPVVWSMPAAAPPAQHIVIDVRTDAPRRQTSAIELPRSWMRMGFRMGGMFGIAVVVFFGTIAGAIWLVERATKTKPQATVADDHVSARRYANQAIEKYGLGQISDEATISFNPNNKFVVIRGFARNEYREVTAVLVTFRVTTFNGKVHWDLFGVRVGTDWKYLHEKSAELLLD